MNTVRLSKQVQRAFDHWIKAPTWDRGHPADEARFYAFVWSVVSYSRRPPDEQDIRSLIQAEYGGKYDADYLERIAINRSILYRNLYEFGKARGKSAIPVIDER